MCEYPNVIGTMKVMEENHLATFCHKYPATNDNQLGVTSAPFTTDDKKLQLGRFYYTMNSVLNHFDKCRDTARVLLFNGRTICYWFFQHACIYILSYIKIRLCCATMKTRYC